MNRNALLVEWFRHCLAGAVLGKYEGELVFDLIGLLGDDARFLGLGKTIELSCHLKYFHQRRFLRF